MCKIAKVSRCLISRTVVEYADVEYTPEGEIYSYDVDGLKDVISMDIIDERDTVAGDDLIKDTETAIEIALKAIDRHGKDKIELLINTEENELYVHYHSEHDSVPLYTFEGYNTTDEFIKEYISDKFSEIEIDICDYC